MPLFNIAFVSQFSTKEKPEIEPRPKTPVPPRQPEIKPVPEKKEPGIKPEISPNPETPTQPGKEV